MEALGVWPAEVLPLSGRFEDRPAWAGYHVLNRLTPGKRRALLDAAATNRPLDRTMGGMLEMAVGDACGAPLEFLPVANGDPDLGGTGTKRPESSFASRP
mmetsp:Transcript_55363/g.125819  ORF Transcript_55363/g.125819 Transcript_55363/m.125819 type:complete len:100 (-) Transcript_55363:893-1192(-)